jgi:hypothetical protein
MNLVALKTEKEGRKCISERHIYTQELMKALRSIEEEQTISYEDLSATIGLDVRPEGAGYPYQHSARAILEREDNIAFEVVVKEGLRRLTPEQVANGTGSIYQKKKRSLIHRSKRRIRTIDDKYDELSSDAKMNVTAHRTILAFDYQLSKPKNLRMIEGKVKETNKLLGFQDTISLFNK